MNTLGEFLKYMKLAHQPERQDSHTQGGTLFVIPIPRSYKQVQKHTLQCLSSLKIRVLVFQYQHSTLIPRRKEILKWSLTGAQRQQVLAWLTSLLLFHTAGEALHLYSCKGKDNKQELHQFTQQ